MNLKNMKNFKASLLVGILVAMTSATSLGAAGKNCGSAAIYRIGTNRGELVELRLQNSATELRARFRADDGWELRSVHLTDFNNGSIRRLKNWNRYPYEARLWRGATEYELRIPLSEVSDGGQANGAIQFAAFAQVTPVRNGARVRAGRNDGPTIINYTLGQCVEARSIHGAPGSLSETLLGNGMNNVRIGAFKLNVTSGPITISGMKLGLNLSLNSGTGSVSDLSNFKLVT